MNPIPTGLSPRGILSRKVEAVLFDIYGTLFISGSGDIGIAEKNSGNAGRLHQLFQEFSIKEPVGIVLKRFFSEIEKTHTNLKSKGIDFPEIRIEEIWKTVLHMDNPKNLMDFSIAYEMCVNPVFPMPNARNVIDHCREKKIVMGIISNAQFFTTRLFHLFFGADPSTLGFDPDLMFLSYQLGYAKPSPYPFQQAVSRLAQKNISPGSVIYIGNDMLNDIYPAHQAGFQTALFAGDKRSLRLRNEDERCKDLKPDIVITDLKGLLDHIL
ncbi:MAG: HAD family hydrolase [Pseudomonadota bacterium]